MVAVCLYFQVHQPFRLRRDYDFFCIGTDHGYEEESLNRDIMRQVARDCYLPANRCMLDLARRFEGRFRVAYSISGVALEQLEMYAPAVIDSFRALVDTGCVELIGETYYHSLAFLFSRDEFFAQATAHRRKVQELFGVTPRTFRNTELIYRNDLADAVAGLGYDVVLAEGADRILQWRSPNFLYSPPARRTPRLLLKNYRLSDDLAFRFSARDWEEYPLTPDKYASWLHQTAGNGDVINIFADYETFGEHQSAASGIFDFLADLPDAVLAHRDYRFLTPGEVPRHCPNAGEIDMPDFVSWADAERDVSAWLGNPMQDGASDYAYSLAVPVRATGDPRLLHTWRKLLTSDHFYYMCTKWAEDGDVHRYFTPFASPHDAYVVYVNILNDLTETLKRRGVSVQPHVPPPL